MPGLPLQLFGTLGTAGADTTGTLVAGGVGTSLYINDVTIVVSAGTVDSSIEWGTALQGTGILARGNFVPGGGVQRTFDALNPPSANNTSLTYRLGGAGTVFFSVSYWVG
mgnify:CR=1 FL=1